MARESFARRLKRLRRAAELSQYELAKRSGLSRQAVSLLELGLREPSWETVRALAKGLGVSILAFDDDEGEPKRRKKGD